MPESRYGYCTVCDKQESVTFYPLFVNGSEGIWLCHTCMMRVVEYIRDMIMIYQDARKMAAYIKRMREETRG